MIEIYLAVSLLGLGYVFNKINNKSIPQQVSPPTTSVVKPSVYESREIEKAVAAERKAVMKHLAPSSKFVSELLNKPLGDDDRVHNNMVPFFRGSGTAQNIDPYANNSILEKYGVSAPLAPPKREQEQFFELRENVIPKVSNVEDIKDRVYISRIQNNILPFEQEKVGPGLGKEFSGKPKGGFNPWSDEKAYMEGLMPKTVDELRVETNPKESYQNRIIQGKKIDKRGIIGNVTKNENKNTYYEQNPERYLKTTGAYLRPKNQSEPVVKETNRKTTTNEYKGNPHKNTGSTKRSAVKEPFRSTLPPFQKGVASLTGRTNKGDYGKTSVQVYSNERDITSTRTHQGNITTIVKSLVAPIQDVVKRNKKEYFVEHAREYGNMSIQIPSKITVKDPNDVTRTTIKETIIHDTQKANLRGAPKITVYDPNSIARTTIKETTIHDGQLTNLVPPIKAGKFSSDIDPKARKTVRETLDEPEKAGNMKSHVFKQTVYDPNDKSRTTIKETTLVEGVIGGVDGKERLNTGYDNLNVDAKMTMKETYVDQDYYGGAQGGTGEAYKNLDFEVRETMKENHEEYYGVAGDQVTEKPTDYSSVLENASTNGIRASALVVDYEPTQNSVKVSQGPDAINMQINRLTGDETSEKPKISRVVFNSKDTLEDIHTRGRQCYEDQRRLDPDILEPFKKNPYTQPLPNSSI